jgi:carbamoyl-phosphate synthase small subunit
MAASWPGEATRKAVAGAAHGAFPAWPAWTWPRWSAPDKSYAWHEGEWALGKGLPAGARAFHVVAYDFGVKRNILRMLVSRGCRVTVVPAQTSPPRCWR